MTVSGIFHSFHFSEFEVVVGSWLVWDQLFTHEHAIGKGLVVTTSEHENSWAFDTDLDHLEIVWKVSSVLNVLVGKILSLSVEYSNWFWILLENEQLLWEFWKATSSESSPSALSCTCICICCSKFVCHCLSLHEVCLSSIFKHLTNISLSIIVSRRSRQSSSFGLNFLCGFTSLKVLKHLIVHELFVASWANKSEQLNHFSYTFVHVSRNSPLTTLHTRSVLIQAMLAVKGAAVLVDALNSVVNNAITYLANEQMVNWSETRWPELAFFHLQKFGLHLSI